MSTHLSYTVDTRPMANEIDSVSRHVNGTTTAVVAMQAAVIKAEKAAADQVCHDVNRGFHALMSSQISQKIAKLQSDVDSHLTRLHQQSKQLMAIKRQMERDYQRTAQRYTKTFNTINKELRIRVQELDQPVFRFAMVEVETTRNRINSLTATIPVVQSEAVADAQRILTSNVKYHGLQVLDSTGTFVAGMEEQKALTKQILLASQKAENQSLYIPVIVSETTSEHGLSSSVYSSKVFLSGQNVSNVHSSVVQSAPSLAWQNDANTNNDTINNEFVRLISESNVSDRVKKTIQNLMQIADKYQSL